VHQGGAREHGRRCPLAPAVAPRHPATVTVAGAVVGSVRRAAAGMRGENPARPRIANPAQSTA
jgi:hypothetical protein